MLCVFGVTAALISYAPPIDAASGPFSINTTLGPAELEMTVEPAKVGLNTIHLYLIDAKTGAQFTATKELTATAKLPAKGIGPLALKADRRGPRPLRPRLRRAQPGGHVGNRNRRPRIRIRTVQPHWSRCPSDEPTEPPTAPSADSPQNETTSNRPDEIPLPRTNPTGGSTAMNAKKIAAAAHGRSAPRARGCAGAHQPAPQHDPRRRLRNARRARPRRAGRGVRQEGRRALPAGLHGCGLRKRARLEHARDRSQARHPDQRRRRNDRHRGLTDRLDLDRAVGQGRTTASSSSSRSPSRSPPTRPARRSNSGPSRPTATDRSIHWISPSLTAEHPSPRINITAKGGVIQDSRRRRGRSRSGADGRRARQRQPRQRRHRRRALRGRAPAERARASPSLALILGALGLIAGLAALIASRRRRA